MKFFHSVFDYFQILGQNRQKRNKFIKLMSRLAENKSGGNTYQDETTQQLQQLAQNMEKITQMNELKQQQAHEAKRLTFENIGLENISVSQLKEMFGKTRLVILCGPQTRAHEIGCELQKIMRLKDFCEIGKSGRNVTLENSAKKFLEISVSTFDGCKQIFIQYIKSDLMILRISEAIKQVQMIRIGSAGGIGVEAGSIVVTSHIVNPITLKSEWTYYSCGNCITQPCTFDGNISEQLYFIAKNKQIPVFLGKTMTTETYYEGQARLDGALCTYTQEAKLEWLTKLYKQGVRNFEMEGDVLSGMCTYNEIPCAMLCVAYLDRLEMDTTPSKYTKQELDSWMQRCVDVVVTYTKKHLSSKKKKSKPQTS
ncbi:hypothetical protein RFI_30549 [Reticulomyxa filosa]|uniref:Nucleoside phosphorylase domain-containing protein n=1 Tax=Reticulomyxa filosa TaxID=46433 RepID=X6LYZ8_RETFI|nr:hypothetical protein RFI_30549 [Reticulomyxa filosa]|eukprot:ETO06844.1 hypothetical protein RFI_30549 [Reticulomyxa filosa]